MKCLMSALLIAGIAANGQQQVPEIRFDSAPNALQLPAARRGDRLGRRLSGAGADRGADVFAGHHVQDDRPLHPAG